MKAASTMDAEAEDAATIAANTGENCRTRRPSGTGSAFTPSAATTGQSEVTRQEDPRMLGHEAIIIKAKGFTLRRRCHTMPSLGGEKS